MRARLVNEIKQDVHSLGLGPIGIGRSKIQAGYEKLKQIYPEIDNYVYPLSDFKEIKVNGLMIGGDSEDMSIGLSMNEKMQISSFTGFPIEDLYFVDYYINSKYDTEELDEFLRRFDIEFKEIKRGTKSAIHHLDEWEFEWCPAVNIGYLELGDEPLIRVVFVKGKS